MTQINDCVIRVATKNGSGSQSSNVVLFRGLFNMGVPVSGKNIFPSNIAGLPTWYSIRISEKGYIGNKVKADVTVLMNPDTFEEDFSKVSPGTSVVYNSKLAVGEIRGDVVPFAVPFDDIVKECCPDAKLRKMVANMIYVGVLAELMGIDLEALHKALQFQFKSKQKAVDLNWAAIRAGFDYAAKNFDAKKCTYKVKASNKTEGQLLITGNESAAIGCLFGGCTLFSWYPITPASSLGEELISFLETYRRDKNDSHRAKFAVIQAEDELAALGMAIGGGWAGARAATSTSGPGISLMAEFSGLAYYTEVPCVIFDVQRLGPSTGLPTRTSQGDISFCHTLSHGDTRHPCLIPSTPQECYEFAMEAFDLAEELQTPIFVLSDLDLGMNNWMSDRFQYPTKPFRHGKVLSADDLEKLPVFNRYEDVDGDGIPYRTLPGTMSSKAAYFTRGSGHDHRARYSESPNDWKKNIDRIARKIEMAVPKLPPPEADKAKGAKFGIIAYGSTHPALIEARDMLADQGLKSDYLRVRSLPLCEEVRSFVERHDRVYMVEQNQQGQMKGIFAAQFPKLAAKICKIRHYNGMPVDALTIFDQIKAKETL